MASISWNALEQRLVLRTPYSSELVAALKALLPSSARRWNPETKTWSVCPEHIGPLVEMLLGFGSVLDVSGDVPPSVSARLADHVHAREEQIRQSLEEARMAATSKAEIIYAWGFPSRREGPSAVNYEVVLRKDMTVSCNCPGWIFNPKRECVHTKEVVLTSEYQAYILEGTLNVWNRGVIPGSRWMGDPDKAPTRGQAASSAPSSARIARRVIERLDE